MSRKKAGAGRPETFSEIVSAEEGRQVVSMTRAAKTLGVAPEMLVGLAQRKHVEAVTRMGVNDTWVWFFPVDEVERLAKMIGVDAG